MTVISPTVSTSGQPPEELDRRLAALFRAQLPHPWPAAPAAAPRAIVPMSAAKPRTRWPLLRTRTAIAASVALLVTGLLFLAEAFPGKTGSNDPDVKVTAPSADTRNDPVHNYDVKVNLQQPPDGPTVIQVDVRDLPSMK
jgi:hypothetical protein